MSTDTELSAMATIKEVLEPLDPEAASRVLRWAADRYSVRLPQVDSEKRGSRINEDEPGQEYAHVADLFEAADPQTAVLKALVVGYWFQKVQQKSDFTGHDVNKELTHLGHGSENITRDLSQLINRKPQLVIQTYKSGKSKQARKRYKLTKEGMRTVEDMLSGDASGA